ncbi:MAG TPA: signal recognition particle receptor subunit alpha [Candidatus Nanoarchaeia archaeon]|nr:signal recognition particle receptor subunit alpha [Candidatus Nanoarchaeia archaeon]
MLEKLSEALKKTTDKIANAVFLDKNLVDQIVKDLQRALIEADVNVALVLEITKKIKQTALDERISGLEKKEHIIKLLHDELLKLLGEKKELKLSPKRNVFMMLGLYGQGKTTTISKLALYYAKRGHKVCAVGLDVHRPAASEQLKQLCDKLNIACFIQPGEKDVKKIWKKYETQIEEYNLVLVDTAGRDALSDDLIKEIKEVSKFSKPTETILVMSADVGQTAKKQASTFKEAVNITGVIITKMDSTAKAGGALTACSEVKAPVVFIGTGETPADLELFNPESFLSRLLGMGDLASLMEKIHSIMDKDKMSEAQRNLEQGKLTMTDFIGQLDSMSSMGGMDKLLSYIPGLGNAASKIPKEALAQQEAKVKRWKNIYNSMSKAERENPELLEKQTARMQRIAKGSGTTTTEIRALLKQYKLLQDMVKSQSSLSSSGQMDQKTIMKMAKKFGRKMKF